MRLENKKKKTDIKKVIFAIRAVGLMTALCMSFAAVTEEKTMTAYASENPEKDYTFSSLQWDTDDDVMMAYWDQSEDDQRYKLQLYTDSVAAENKVGAAVTVTNKDYYDFTKLVVSKGAGNYIFTVTGMKENDTQQSPVAYIDLNKLHSIEDKYIGEHPRAIFGKYDIVKMDMIRNSDPVTLVNMGTAKPGTAIEQSVIAGAAAPFTTTVTARNGWLRLKDSGWYHFTNGIMDTGWYVDQTDGNTYYLNPDGTMRTGYLYLDGRQYYFDASGKLAI